MSIASYTDLKTFITAHLELDSATQAKLDDFITLAEADLARRILAPERDVVETASTVAGTQTLALPSGFRSARSILVNDDYPLTPVTLNFILSNNSDSVSGEPQMYCIAGQSIYLSPIPDAVYTITLFGQAGITALSATNASNWLLAAHPDAYLYATLLQVEAYLANDKRLPLIEGKLAQVVDEINRQGNRYRNSGPMRLRSPVVV